MISAILSMCMLASSLVCTVRQQPTSALWRGASPGLEGPEAAVVTMRESWQDPRAAGETAEAVPGFDLNRGPTISLTDLRLQMLVAEAGFGRHPDHAAFLHAMDRLAKLGGRTVEAAIRKHISEFAFGWKPGREWIGNLTQACLEPAGWPKRRSWSGGSMHGCVRLVAMVRLHARGKLKDPCRGRPNQWRSRKAKKAIRAALRRGMRRIGCGADTLHVFLRLPVRR